MLDGLLARSSPRLPVARFATRVTPLSIAGALHLLTATLIVLSLPPATTRIAVDEPMPPATIRVVPPSDLLFLSDKKQGAGGGGGGNRQAGPIRRAEGVGRDALTMRTTSKPPEATLGSDEPAIVPFVLDARPLASGVANQIGLPGGGVAEGTSTGPGTGGGVGSGTGTGLGSGRGPGVGPGSGGGFGGGAYREGGAITSPRLLEQVRPNYTSEALERRIQGEVWLDIVVTREGRVGDIRVRQALDPGGLDDEAIKAARLWRFAPGRLSGQPVDVVVTLVMDFSIR
jgi:periplasmic protein TonB